MPGALAVPDVASLFKRFFSRVAGFPTIFRFRHDGARLSLLAATTDLAARPPLGGIIAVLTIGWNACIGVANR